MRRQRRSRSKQEPEPQTRRRSSKSAQCRGKKSNCCTRPPHRGNAGEACETKPLTWLVINHPANRQRLKGHNAIGRQNPILTWEHRDAKANPTAVQRRNGADTATCGHVREQEEHGQGAKQRHQQDTPTRSHQSGPRPRCQTSMETRQHLIQGREYHGNNQKGQPKKGQPNSKTQKQSIKLRSRK